VKDEKLKKSTKKIKCRRMKLNYICKVEIALSTTKADSNLTSVWNSKVFVVETNVKIMVNPKLEQKTHTQEVTPDHPQNGGLVGKATPPHPP